MSFTGLSFNALPPIDLPFRFFICAPLFIIACAFFVIFSGESLWLTRWTPSMLALTHGFTLGFVTMVMMGALLQLLPVIGGIGIEKPRRIVTICHLFYCFGVICLLFAFVYSHAWLTLLATVSLMLGIAPYLLAITKVLVKKVSQGHSIVGFRLAIIALFVVLVLGVMLLSSRLGFNFPSVTLTKHTTDVHALWGLVGWVGLLIVSVSYQVLPMFHVAPNFPNVIQRYLACVLLILLVLFVFSPELVMPLLFFSHAVFALCLLYVIDKRKRKVPDTTILYWQLAAASLLVLNVLYFLPETLFQQIFNSGASQNNNSKKLYILSNKPMLLTAIFIYFYVVSVIQGMLLKILPFLSYTHLQQRCLMNFSAMQCIPHMHDFLAKKHGKWLYYMHLLTGGCLVLVLINPSFYLCFGLALFVEFSWLLFLMVKCMRLYFTVNDKITLSIAD